MSLARLLHVIGSFKSRFDDVGLLSIQICLKSNTCNHEQHQIMIDKSIVYSLGDKVCWMIKQLGVIHTFKHDSRS